MKMRKNILFVILIVLVIIIYPAFINIGHMSGAENEKVVIYNDDGSESVYVLCDCEHTVFDRGRIIGNVDGSYDTSYYVFKADSDYESGCVYVANMGRGDYYSLSLNITE